MLVRLLLCCVVLVSWVIFFWLCESWLKGNPAWNLIQRPVPSAEMANGIRSTIFQWKHSKQGPLFIWPDIHRKFKWISKTTKQQSLPSQLEPAALTTTRSWTCPIISWPHSREASKCWRRDCRDLFTTVVVSPWAVLLFHLDLERTRVTIISLYLLPLLHTRHVDHPPILSNFKQILRNSLKKLWKSCL